MHSKIHKYRYVRIAMNMNSNSVDVYIICLSKCSKQASIAQASRMRMT